MNRTDQHCINCNAFRANGGDKNTGWCLANPPQLISSTIEVGGKGPLTSTQGMWPPVGGNAWCRAWQQKEDDNG